MRADVLSRNAIDAVGIFSDQSKLEKEKIFFSNPSKNKRTATKKDCNYKHLEISDYCFMEESCGEEFSDTASRKL